MRRPDFCLNDDARLGGEFGTRHLPMGGDVIEEHGAHLRAKGAQDREEAGYDARLLQRKGLIR